MTGTALSAHDVAAYILENIGTMTTMKLQKLVYYSQAWSLVWDDEPLFKERIEAWANGPVVRELYDVHKGKYQIRKWSLGDSSKLSQIQKDTVDAVLEYYGEKSSQWLSELTHNEDPWRLTRGCTPDGSRDNTEITHASMAEYYSSLE